LRRKAATCFSDSDVEPLVDLGMIELEQSHLVQSLQQ